MVSQKTVSGITNYSYTYNANKQKLTETDGTMPNLSQTFAYDFENEAMKAKFSWLAQPEGQDHGWSQQFDNQLAFSTAGTPSVNASYAYDALGRRVSKSSNNTVTVFVHSNYQILTEYKSINGGSFTEHQSFVYATYIDDPIALININGTYYYHSNQQFSISAITDSNGNLSERYGYNAYGKPVVISDSILVDNPYFFTGRQLDSETGLFYFRARYYDPSLGQFISRDPIGYVDGMNLYRGYFAINKVDPYGLDENTTYGSTPRYSVSGLTVVAFGDTKNAGVFGITKDFWWGNTQDLWLEEIGRSGANVTTFSFNNSLNIIADPVEIFTKNLKKITTANKTCIKILNIVGHGLSGAGVMSRPLGSGETEEDNKGNLGLSSDTIGTFYGNQIASTLCADAIVNLCACKSGQDLDALQAMATLMKVKVCGCTGNVVPRCTCLGRTVCKSPK